MLKFTDEQFDPFVESLINSKNLLYMSVREESNSIGERPFEAAFVFVNGNVIELDGWWTNGQFNTIYKATHCRLTNRPLGVSEDILRAQVSDFDQFFEYVLNIMNK